jgi:hypothetical protein
MKDKSAVNYRPGDEKQSCGNCTFFISPDKCSEVKGQVDAGGNCDLWMPMQPAEPMPGEGTEAAAGAEPNPEMIAQMLFGGGAPNA